MAPARVALKAFGAINARMPAPLVAQLLLVQRVVARAMRARQGCLAPSVSLDPSAIVPQTT